MVLADELLGALDVHGPPSPTGRVMMTKRRGRGAGRWRSAADVDRLADRQPANAPGDIRGGRELALEGVAPLLEVGPALVVDRDGDAGADEPAELDRVAAGHRVADRPGHRELHAAQVQQGGVHVEALGHLAQAPVEDRVAGDPERAAVLSLPPEREADHVAGERLAERRAVAAGGGGDIDRRPAPRLQPRRLPRRQAAGPAAEPARAGRRRHDRPRRRQQRPPRGVEVVAVVVVGQQHGVDRRQVGDRDRRPGGLARARPPAEAVAAAGGVERRVGQQPPAAGLDEDRRPADVGQDDAQPVAPVRASAQSSA